MSLLNDLWLCRKPLAGFVAVGAAWSMYFAQMPVIKAATGASDGAYGAVMLVASCGALAAMWLAPLADRFLGRWAMPLGCILMAAGMLSAGSSMTLVMLGVSMTLASIGAGVTDVLVNVRVSEIEERSGRNLMNLNHGMFSVAYAGGALLTGVLRELSWTPVQIFAVMAALILVLCWIILEDRPTAMTGETPELSEAVPHSVVWVAGGIVLVAFLTESSTEGWAALHLERTLDGGPGEGAMGPALLGISMAIGRFGGHFLSNKISEMPIIVMASVIASFGLVIAGTAQTIPIAYVGFGLAGLGISVVGPLALALVGRIVPGKARLAAMSRAAVMGYGAFFLGPPLMGFTSEWFGLRAGFLVVAGLLMLAIVVLVPILARHAAQRLVTSSKI